MQKKIFQRNLWIISLLFFFILGIIYNLTTEKIYSSKSQVALFRLKIELPESGTEESRNRWIWIRDGLNIKSALANDEALEKIIATNSTAHEISIQYNNRQKMLDYLKSLINIQFTGADENNYIVEVHAPTSELSIELNTLIFDRIKYFAVDEDHLNFQKIIAELKKKQEELKSSSSDSLLYQDKLNKMIFNHTIEQKQRENSYHIISQPTLNPIAIWPNSKLIMLVFSFIGIVIGLCLDFTLRNKRAK